MRVKKYYKKLVVLTVFVLLLMASCYFAIVNDVFKVKSSNNSKLLAASSVSTSQCDRPSEYTKFSLSEDKVYRSLVSSIDNIDIGALKSSIDSEPGFQESDFDSGLAVVPNSKSSSKSSSDGTSGTASSNGSVSGGGTLTAVEYFYKATCEKDKNIANISFDFGDDKSSETDRQLYGGEGFGIAINVNYVNNCKLEFNKDTFEAVYNKYLYEIINIKSNLEQYVTNNDYDNFKKTIDDYNKKNKDNPLPEAELNDLWNKIQKLLTVLDGYLTTYRPDNFFEGKNNDSIEFTMEYKDIDGNKKKIDSSSNDGKYKFQKITIKNESSSTLEKEKKACDKSSNKCKVCSNNKCKNIPDSYEIKREIKTKYVPKTKSIDSLGNVLVNDEISSKKNKSVNEVLVNAGNKIYLDSKIKPKTYTPTIKVTVKILGEQKVISNENCKIEVLENGEILYRSVDLNNPFINKKWEVSGAWLNSKYDFRGIIDPNTWSKFPLYDLNFTSDEVEAIRKSNSNFKDDYPYLGLCNRVSNNILDATSKKLCTLINGGIVVIGKK